MELREANFADIEQEWAFVRDMPLDENGLTNSWHGVSREEFESKALPSMINAAKGKGLPEGYVPETVLFLWKGNEIIGQYRIRHYLCESLRTGAGHIGYFIAKPYRNKGYGKEGLRLTLAIARKIIPEDEIYLRVNRNNPASLHVMLKNGGRVVSEDDEHFFVRISKGTDIYNIRQAEKDDVPVAAELACSLWPDHTLEEMKEEFYSLLDSDNAAIFLCFINDNPIGFAQCQLRHDYVEGTETSPVGYLEGIYVAEGYRRHGVARNLLSACETWAKEKGCSEFASDCELTNIASQCFHQAIGFNEANRIVAYTKKL